MKYSKKQRSSIYLNAAKKEDAEHFSGVHYINRLYVISGSFGYPSISDQDRRRKLLPETEWIDEPIIEYKMTSQEIRSVFVIANLLLHHATNE